MRIEEKGIINIPNHTIYPCLLVTERENHGRFFGKLNYKLVISESNEFLRSLFNQSKFDCFGNIDGKLVKFFGVFLIAINEEQSIFNADYVEYEN